MAHEILRLRVYPFIALALAATMIVFASPGLAQTCSTPSFSGPPIYPVGNGSDVRSIASADFDGDGRPDLAVADDESSTVIVFIGVARGVPAVSHTYNVGTHPLSVAAGDFNGDGKQDLATANDSTNNLTLLLGDGAGVFSAGGSFAVGQSPRAIAVGDFNGDGRADAAVATLGGTTVLRGSSGGFSAPLSFPGAYSFITTVDFNSDGKLDLGLGTNNSIEIRLGDGAGQFTPPACGAGPGANGIAMGDLNGDGKPDLVGAYVLAGKIQIMLNNGLGCLGPPVSVDVLNAGRPRYPSLGDLNGDGKLDIVAGTTVLVNDGSGNFGAPVYYGSGSTGQEPGANTLVVDFDGDGKLDIATAGSGSVGILFGDGGGSFKFAAGPAERGVWGAASGDLIGDGKLDLVLSTSSNATVKLGDGLGGFGPITNFALPVSSNDNTAVADFNRDSKLDVVTLDSSHNGPGGLPRVHVLPGDDAGNLGPAISSSINDDQPLAPSAGDFNGDGNPDLAILNRSGAITQSTVSIVLGDGAGHFSQPVKFPVGVATNPKPAAVADLNGDGKLDLAVPGGGSFNTLLGDGAGGFGAATVSSFVNADSIAVSDFNGDGKLDLAMVGFAIEGKLSIAFGNGSGGFSAPVQFAIDSYPEDLTVADFNGDGKADVAVAHNKKSPVQNAVLSSVSVLLGDGAGGFGPPASFPADRTPTRILTGDFNNDGRPDLVTANRIANNLSVLLNTCNGPIGPPPVVGFSAPAYASGEGGGNATVTITRTGNTFSASSVAYATSDTAGANNCNVTNGAASSRCDYLTTIGTLQFAANETSKTISVPIVDDAYVEGSESFTITLSNPVGAGVGANSSATITITDNDAANGANPIDVSSFFVRQHYLDFLNREPDTAGLNFWVSELENCTPKPQCTEIKRINVSAAFFLSIEFQETGYLVYRIYKASYGNISGTPTPLRLNEFLPDTQQIGKGVVVGVGNWQMQLEANKIAFASEFVTRNRFTNHYATTMTPAQFVDALFTNAGVTPAASDRDAVINEFSGAGSTADAVARGRALRRVAENSILRQQETNRAFVLMQYFGYLRRNPNDPPEQNLNFDGYNFWLGKLDQFNGNFVNAEMVKAFIVSGEYRQRFGP
jgi:hypothetical protein